MFQCFKYLFELGTWSLELFKKILLYPLTLTKYFIIFLLTHMDLSSMSPTSKLWLTGLLALAFGAFGLNQLFLSGVSYKNFAHWQKPGNISDTITVTGRQGNCST